MLAFAAPSDVLVAVLLAALLAAVLVLLVYPFFGGAKPAAGSEDWELERQQLAGDLAQWTADLRVLATSLRLGHWGDVRYALQWRTLDPPASLLDALDWESIGGQRGEALNLFRVIGLADELAQIAVMVERTPMLQGSAAATRATVTYSASDYANALLVLADAAARARAGLDSDTRVGSFAQQVG
ncbi:hypothetical protein [Pseudoxanthomonas sp. X-1]|uniref:hypothetical protein n=1 Tax=Pseudoxanthomonas sp. X-1 TaxID=2571115 RepID=UPI00110BA36D|nr:hypothetical protein [Pseudoxanthomonas sp. X-1]TMN18941.1 hypothetical protein FF950_13020 [Pseudoxanthomonas sp. X-1]UAY74526.1 hypothetical protein LAJ50_19155 [Pseudoxanthomonas sp. X-1]